MHQVEIITHRGLEPSNPNFFPESSIEAFQNHLSRGFGIEFDLNFAKDGIVVSHDATLTRITNGQDTRPFEQLTIQEATHHTYGAQKKGTIGTLEELLKCMEKGDPNTMHALHLKGKFQEVHYIDDLLQTLAPFTSLLPRIIIFDVKPSIASYIKSKNPNCVLAPSVAHPYDITRYNSAVLGTLISLDDAIRYKKDELYEWAWLDEWDLTGEHGTAKTFYNQETFQILKQAGYQISLVTPELHGTSPGLLGGEAHPDAATKETLFKRIRKIIHLQPDAICTDYPEEAKKW